jgi:hypothetical protein
MAARHGGEARKPLVTIKAVLVDCLIYRGFFDTGDDTPQLHRIVMNPSPSG